MISASVLLSKRGGIEKIDTRVVWGFSQSGILFGKEIEKVLNEAAFSPNCAGKTVQLVFHFRSSDSKKTSVSFGYPNAFWILQGPTPVQPEEQTTGQPTWISGQINSVAGPLPGAIIAVMRSGAPTAISRSGPDGTFRFSTALTEGDQLIIEFQGFRQRRLPIHLPASGAGLDVGDVLLEVPPEPPMQVFFPDPIRGRYANVDYGFAANVPPGRVGEVSVAPNPNHGFAVRLGGKSVVWVDASYDMPDSPHKFARLNAKLGNLSAERTTWRDTNEGTELFHESIAARGFDRRTPIIFTIQLDTTEEHRAEGLKVFTDIVNSFRTFPVR
jgi:hypothetical protein